MSSFVKTVLLNVQNYIACKKMVITNTHLGILECPVFLENFRTLCQIGNFSHVKIFLVMLTENVEIFGFLVEF